MTSSSPHFVTQPEPSPRLHRHGPFSSPPAFTKTRPTRTVVEFMHAGQRVAPGCRGSGVTDVRLHHKCYVPHLVYFIFKNLRARSWETHGVAACAVRERTSREEEEDEEEEEMALAKSEEKKKGGFHTSCLDRSRRAALRLSNPTLFSTRAPYELCLMMSPVCLSCSPRGPRVASASHSRLSA